MIGQMMEPVEFPEKYEEPELPPRDWAATGCKDREPRIIKSLFLDPVALEKNCQVLYEKYERMKKEEIRYELYNVNPKIRMLLIAYGTMARICQTAIDELKEEGITVGLFRPISLFPFPQEQILAEVSKRNIQVVLTVEMSTAQMLEDVERAVLGKKPVRFFGHTGGIVPSPEEVKEQILGLLKTTRGSRPRKKKARG